MNFIAKTDWRHDDPISENDLNRWETGIDDSHKKSTEIFAQLAEKTTFSDQTDFVALLAQHTDYDQMYYKRENTPGWLTVSLVRGTEHISWTFRNNTYDDYWTLGDCFTGVFSESDVIYQNVDYSNLTGTWVTSATNAHYTTQINATFQATISGKRIDFHHYADNRGGIWEFVLDGDTENPVTVSTYSASPVVAKPVTLFDDLADVSHTVVGTFKGADPANAPSGGVARGWVWFSNGANPSTFRSYRLFFTNSRVKDLMIGFSNKEFALRLRKSGTTHTHQFVPMHSNIGTAFNAESRRIIVDGQNIDTTTLVIGEYFKCSDVQIAQRVYGRNPESGSENLVEIATTVSINKKGIAEINGKMNVLVNVDVADGYFAMLPVSKPTIDRLATSINNYYAATKTDGTKTFLATEKDKATSYLFTSSVDKNYGISIRFNDSKNSLRTGANGKYPEANRTWIEHRDTNMTKLYSSIFYNTTLTAGQTFRWSSSLLAARVTGIHDVV